MPILRSEQIAKAVRKHVVRMTYKATASHVASGLSVADILSVLYSSILRVDPSNQDFPERDRLVFSKGHAAASLYATLSQVGFFAESELDKFCMDCSPFAGHSTCALPGIEVSTGSLGHGLPIATGMALAAARGGKSWRTFCVSSDGELNEGSVWEAAFFAGHHGLDDLTLIVDYNKFQAMGKVETVLNPEPMSAKWESFNWAVAEVDGHDHAALHEVLQSLPNEKGKPSVVLAHTTKGKGVSFMEDELQWHYRSPRDSELEKALRELE